MSPIHLDGPVSVTLDGVDLAPYVAASPAVTVRVSDQRDRSPAVRFGARSIRMRMTVEPCFYRQVTGRKHPRVTGLRRAYRGKRRHW